MASVLTTYLTLVAVSSVCIAFGTSVDITVAIATAAVSCMFKTVAIKIHDKVWSKFTTKKINHDIL